VSITCNVNTGIDYGKRLACELIASVEFLGTQRVVTETHRVDIPVSEKTSLKDALDYINQQYPSLGLDDNAVIITVNSEISSPGRILKANDIVLFLPVIGGG